MRKMYSLIPAIVGLVLASSSGFTNDMDFHMDDILPFSNESYTVDRTAHTISSSLNLNGYEGTPITLDKLLVKICDSVGDLASDNYASCKWCTLNENKT